MFHWKTEYLSIINGLRLLIIGSVMSLLLWPNSAMLIPGEYENSAGVSYAMISFLFMSDLNTDLCFSLSDPIRRSIPERDFGEISVTIFARYVFSTHDLTDFSGMGYMTLLRASARILM